jgi:hemerythrin-like metal-binding protein
MLAASFEKGIGMTVLHWSDSYNLGISLMDATHIEFVDLQARVLAAPDAQLMPLWQELVEHTESHFAREDRWMQDTGFSSDNCHSSQHKLVLQVMQEGLKRGLAGDLAVVRQMANELGLWFPQHANAMDAALAQHLQAVAYDETTGRILQPQALPREVIEGCHSDSCAPHAPADAKLAIT